MTPWKDEGDWYGGIGRRSTVGSEKGEQPRKTKADGPCVIAGSSPAASQIDAWCSGSTTGFGPVSQSSTLCASFMVAVV